VIIAGHAFMQNLRRGHYEIAIEVPAAKREVASLSTKVSNVDTNASVACRIESVVTPNPR